MSRHKSIFFTAALSAFFLFFFPGLGLVQEQDKKEEQEVTDEELMELLGMTVETTSKKEESIMKTPGVVSVITSAEIRELGIQSVADAVGLLTGVFKYESTGNLYNLFAIRGFFAEQQYNAKNLFLINGHPIYVPVHGGFEVNMIPLEAVERIELLRGPVSVMYGTNALTGVINIVTKKEPTFLNGEIRYQYGSFGTHDFRASFGKTTEDARYFVSGTYRDSEGHDVIVKPEQDQAGIGKSHKQYLKMKNIFFNVAYKDLEVDILYWKQSHLPKAGLVPNTMFYVGDWDMDYLCADMRYAYGINENTKLNFKLRLDSSYLGMIWPAEALPSGEQPEGVRNNKIGTEAYAEVNVSKKLSMIAGVLFDRYKTNKFENLLISKFGLTFSFHGPDSETSDTAAYANFNYRVSEPVSLVGGFRYTDNSITGGHTDYRLGSILNLKENVVLKVLYGTSYRSPMHDDLFTNGFPMIMGNRNLDFEVLKGLDISLNYNYENKLLTSVNYYWSKVENSINLRPINFVNTFVNIKGQEVQGVEFDLKYRPSRVFSFFFNSSNILSAQDLELDTELGYIVKNMLNFGFAYKPVDFLTISNTNIYRSAWGDSDSFFLSNLSFLYTLPVVQPGIELFITANNIFDEEYTYSEYTNRLTETIPGGPPRSVTAGIILSF